ncbi:hypothetical protein [Aquisalimonas sp.]|uniref:hypothetical protein n=1 Tax=Aquisalimonas sp. TaxID=1872621 RepID=UPI0025C2854F|nr:hypothetical protein [Aquisalimonas sp.]
MECETLYYPGFREKWQATLETTAESAAIESLLIMRSTPTHMVTAVSARPRRDTYHPGDSGPNSIAEDLRQALASG